MAVSKTYSGPSDISGIPVARTHALAFNHFICTKQCWAEAPIKIARMTLTIKLDGNWSSFQLANSAPPLSVTDSAIAPSARMVQNMKNTLVNLSLIHI